MWPDIKYRKENKKRVGYEFDSEFWKLWGPTLMYYYNENIYDDSKPIKSIYCMYNHHNTVEFIPEEIAMALKYECGDFGEHIVLFSYVDYPKLDYTHTWNWYVYPEGCLLSETDILLKKLSLEMKSGNMSKEQAYLTYLERTIIKEEKSLYELSEKIIRIIRKSHPDISDEEAYKMLLEKIFFHGYENGGIGKINTSNRFDFEKSVYKVITEYEPILKCEPLEKFEKDLEWLEIDKEKNDLDSIFRQCREYFKNRVQKDCKIITNVPIWDKETFTHIGTEEQEVEIGVDGYIEKDEQGKVIFYQYQENIEK